MTLRLGLVGAGEFLPHFTAMFAAHPGVGAVYVADLVTERAEALVAQFGLAGAARSLDDLLVIGIDAVAIFTPRHTHAPLALQAMKAGAHVYIAVPAAVALEELAAMTGAAARHRRICMTGETSYYYPEIVFAREEFATGRWGRFIHADAQYVHDWATWGPHFRLTFGDDWQKFASIPPMFYPTHSFSMPLSITGARVTHISAHGFVDHGADAGYGAGRNPWDNPFSNTVALARTSDGGTLRIGEFRRVGWFPRRNGREVMMPTFYASDACMESSMASTFLTGRQGLEGSLSYEHPGVTVDLGPWVDGPYFEHGTTQDRHLGLAPAHHPARLPKEYRGLDNGHSGSHQFLVDDFVRACIEDALPPTHIWASASWCAPGLVAHHSALRGGALMEVPDFGQPPEYWPRLTYPPRGDEAARPRLPDLAAPAFPA